jgi:hypothetical protein
MRGVGLLCVALLAIGCSGEPKGSGGNGGAEGDGGADLGMGGASVTASCDYRAVVTVNYCQEYSAAPDIIAPYKSACSGSNGKWSAGGCSHAQSVGGCTTTSSSPPIILTSWFYVGGPYTVDQSKSACATSGGTWVAP